MATPLFITEDGKEIFEGDKYYQLVLTFEPVFRDAIYEEIGRCNIIYDYSILEKKKQLNSNGRYYFSTKEAAEEYILMNKPCLSLADVATVYKGINKKTNHPSSQANQLKELVKSKLKY